KADTAAKDSEEESPKGSEMQKADEEAMKRMAEEIQKRAAAGEDFDQLQREAYQAAGIGGSPAPTSIGKLTRSQIPIDQRKAVDLKVGEVSPLYTEPNGFYIYKVLSKEAKPLEEARDEIRTTLSQQRVKDAMAKYQQENTAILNEAYFAPASPPPPPRTGPGGPSAPGPAGNPQSRATPPSTNSKPASPQASQK
ncbi:MAG: peptidyl-prolyl cis-trans isomerase, partial [Acidobacteria bacterium]|nr:peptidyl-prolyl cis-trans isomerase [Acidobacteriota bacterium]